ncbi:hypothetical protein PMAYCL1PPCAC_10702 [Pristionchus mayeri]|uniref:Uncharacterized protein n=1 Tax=Pristionchus mayeri TaxID=1317129 RepID=A0AAN4ZG40_9BILA|nr:hypothetical protein PMAYCL1PPCAC_10702 [Pristionchus mayeri]
MMDWYPEKIKCCKTKLQTHSELRKSIVRDPLPIPNDERHVELMSENINKEYSSSSAFEQVEKQLDVTTELSDNIPWKTSELQGYEQRKNIFGDELLMAATVLEACVKMHNAIDEENEGDDEEAYAFDNEAKTQCFANAAVNMVLSLKPLVQEFEDHGTANDVVELLLEASQRTLSSRFAPQRLRHLFPAFEVGQQDPSEFLLAIIARMDTNIKKHFEFEVEYRAKCKRFE